MRTNFIEENNLNKPKFPYGTWWVIASDGVMDLVKARVKPRIRRLKSKYTGAGNIILDIEEENANG